MKDRYKRLAVVGLGLIGSSIAKAVKEHGLADEIVAYDGDAGVRRKAAKLKLGDRIAESAPDAVDGADLVILAVPVGAMASVAEGIAGALAPGAAVADTGSTKTSVIRDVAPLLPDNVDFLPSHPVAGTEHSGPEAGFSTLFKDRYWLVVGADADRPVIDRFIAFLSGTGAIVEEMEAEYHDKVMAITSHLPHLIAYTIVGTAFDFEKQVQNDVIRFSASGFRDFTRIASSDPVMWRDVFLNNSDAVLEMLARFNEDLSYLQRAIRWSEGGKLEDLFIRTRDIRKRIKDAGQLD